MSATWSYFVYNKSNKTFGLSNVWIMAEFEIARENHAKDLRFCSIYQDTPDIEIRVIESFFVEYNG